jgi:phosphate-selective porin OprO/OprP
MHRPSSGLARRLSGAAAAAALLAGAGQALAADPAPSGSDDTAALRAQVAQLSQLVQTLSQRDQQQISALSAQVASLQARLEAQEATQTAAPRAAQNPGGQPHAVAGQPALAAEGGVPRVVQNSTHRFALTSDDGRYSIGLVGLIQFDSGAYLDFHPDSPLAGPQELSNGINARRARIGVAGTAAGDWSYAFIYDGGNSQDTSAKGIETAQVIYGGLAGAAFEIGYSNTYFTLDQSTASADLLFLERATPSNIATNFNAGDFRSNAGFRFFGDRYWLGAYVTGPASGDSHTTTGERLGSFQRVAFQALKGDDYTVHVGAAVDELLRAPNSGYDTPNTLSLNDQPELRIDPTTLLNTGTLGTAANPVTRGYVFNVETAANFRNFFWQGEYYHYQIDRGALANNDFNGWYGQVSWTLTGEVHRYNPQAGSYLRIVPDHPFSWKDGEWGAWEIAARYSYINLDSDFITGQSLSSQPNAVEGGAQRGYTLGLNWYPNDIVKLMLDYNHIDFQKYLATTITDAPLGTPIGAKFDAVSLRVQVAY